RLMNKRPILCSCQSTGKTCATIWDTKIQWFSLLNDNFLSFLYSWSYGLEVVRFQLLQRVLLCCHNPIPSFDALVGSSSSQEVHSSRSVCLGTDE
ncbi:mCG1030985, partial [Mus musculus]